MLDEPILPIPLLGKNPFKTQDFLKSGYFKVKKEKYLSPASEGTVTFDYSNNNGTYIIGQDNLLFEIKFSSANDICIHLYNDPSSIKTVALIKDKSEIEEVIEAYKYDTSSRCRTIYINQLAVLENNNGFYAIIKILDIKHRTKDNEYEEITFKYKIQTNGKADFN